MSELSRQTRQLLKDAKNAERMPTADKARIHASLARRAGGALGLGGALSATGRAAAGATHAAAAKFTFLGLPLSKVLVFAAVIGGAGFGAGYASHVATGNSPVRTVSSWAAEGPRPAKRGVTPQLPPTADAGESTAPPAIATPRPNLSTPRASPGSPEGSPPQPQVTLPPSGGRGASAAARVYPDRLSFGGSPPSLGRGGGRVQEAVRQESLGRELVALRTAQSALREGNPGRALEEIDGLSRTGARLVLEEEFAAARVFALCDLGRTVEARSIAEQFLSRFSLSPLASRVRASCAARQTETR